MSTQRNPTVTTEANVKCPYCAEVIAAEAKKCKHCGEFLDSNLRQAKMPSPVPLEQPWNPGVAAVLSLVIPGAGQIYKGQLKPGIWWLVGVIVGYTAFIIPGLILHIYCIYNAYTDDPAVPKGSKGK
jgi:TM2 domain-containing membrane protein YozV